MRTTITLDDDDDVVALLESERARTAAGLVLASREHGFRRFTGLRVVDPLTPDA